MEINIDDYLSENEKKEIVILEYKKVVRERFETEKDIQRILSNASYSTVYQVVDDLFDLDSKQIMRENIKDILSKKSSYHLFKKPDAWCKETNRAYDYLQSCINENKPAIKDKVNDLIDEQIVIAAKADIKEVVTNSILDLIESY